MKKALIILLFVLIMLPIPGNATPLLEITIFKFEFTLPPAGGDLADLFSKSGSAPPAGFKLDIDYTAKADFVEVTVDGGAITADYNPPPLQATITDEIILDGKAVKVDLWSYKVDFDFQNETDSPTAGNDTDLILSTGFLQHEIGPHAPLDDTQGKRLDFTLNAEALNAIGTGGIRNLKVAAMENVQEHPGPGRHNDVLKNATLTGSVVFTPSGFGTDNDYDVKNFKLFTRAVHSPEPTSILLFVSGLVALLAAKTLFKARNSRW